MNQRSIDRWRRLRVKGKRYFIIRYGIVGWGLGFAVLFYLFECLMGQVEDFFLDAIIYLVISLAGGYAWGLTMWFSMERLYGKKQGNG